MLRLPSSWVWDFWFADDGEVFHLFFLKASRALVDPNRRHWRASIGHATSTDLVTWTEHADALVPDEESAFDDLATWTGSVVRDGSGLWHMFYTGVSHASKGVVQRIGSATSVDLFTWNRPAQTIVVGPRFDCYESLAQNSWPDEAWRDPWVFADPTGNGWHMLVTARAKEGARDERGVVGHAWSPELDTWEVLPPLSATDSGFGQLEVLQLAEVEGKQVLLFSCMTPELSEERRARGERGGIWAVNTADMLGPFDIASAYRLADERLYVGRLIQTRDRSWWLLAFKNITPSGDFVGEITDPLPVAWVGDRLTIPSEASGLSEAELPGIVGRVGA